MTRLTSTQPPVDCIRQLAVRFARDEEVTLSPLLSIGELCIQVRFADVPPKILSLSGKTLPCETTLGHYRHPSILSSVSIATALPPHALFNSMLPFPCDPEISQESEQHSQCRIFFMRYWLAVTSGVLSPWPLHAASRWQVSISPWMIARASCDA